ncbi:ABC transporter ATP-binding protein [Bifidobacterium platyrrhinorum]|uniref:ATP-binding cassette domain-containing protein n=1 Tax=Bifidobacterium platyrrhinorum TaxID=2661628 RepID=A0A6L9SU93_9BIFI|nr:dipeptide/oligopeptide/nickel ABC transporter ATP-binding protein [Bifidobacterium platyrrhinorum]NEG55122.1 ATP-binding cassette domain-containing protein [Bifidobacterium platyrrhinorum]
MTTPLLELRHVTVRHGAFAAVDDVSLAVPRGGALGIVGESGAGKSTLARVAAGLVAPAGGATLLDGGELAPIRRTRAQRRRIQMVFQNPDSSLNPRHTVRRILAEGMLLHGTLGPRPARADVDARCRELLRMVGLDGDMLDRLPRAFSGGQRQRIALARALAVRPDVLVADEPTSALDVSVQREVLDLLAARRRDQGLALLLITHDLGVAAALCDDVAVMRAGRIVARGPARTLLADPPAGYARELVDAARAVAL